MRQMGIYEFERRKKKIERKKFEMFLYTNITNI